MPWNWTTVILIVIFNLYIIRLLFEYKNKTEEQSLRIIHLHLDQQFFFEIIRIVNLKNSHDFDKVMRMISYYYDIQYVAIFSPKKQFIYSSSTDHNWMIEQYIENNLTKVLHTITKQKFYTTEITTFDKKYEMKIGALDSRKSKLLIFLFENSEMKEETISMLHIIKEMIYLINTLCKKTSSSEEISKTTPQKNKKMI